MNWIKVLGYASTALSIISSLVSGYVSKQTMQHMIKEEISKAMYNG